MATALLGLQTHQYVLGKSEFVALYRQHVNDAWTPFLADLDTTCRRQWGYLIPSTAKDRSKLRALCGQYLGFERHFLSTYRDFALAKLGGTNEGACLQALHALRDLPYQDSHIKAALRLLCSHHSQRLGDAAKEARQALGYVRRTSGAHRAGVPAALPLPVAVRVSTVGRGVRSLW